MKQLTKLLAIIACFAFVTTSVFAQATTEKKQEAIDAIVANLPEGKTLSSASEYDLSVAIEQAVTAAVMGTDNALTNALVEVAGEFNFEVVLPDADQDLSVQKAGGGTISTEPGSITVSSNASAVVKKAAPNATTPSVQVLASQEFTGEIDDEALDQIEQVSPTGAN